MFNRKTILTSLVSLGVSFAPLAAGGSPGGKGAGSDSGGKSGARAEMVGTAGRALAADPEAMAGAAALAERVA